MSGWSIDMIPVSRTVSEILRLTQTFGGHDHDCLASRNVIDHVTIGLTM